MLMAMDEDPGRCGYTNEQIKSCLASIEHQKINQIGEDSDQLLFLLERKALISKTSKGISGNSNTMKLRFDHVVSPLQTIPRDIRKSLITILAKYTQGAITRTGKHWQEYKI